MSGTFDSLKPEEVSLLIKQKETELQEITEKMGNLTEELATLRRIQKGQSLLVSLLLDTHTKLTASQSEISHALGSVLELVLADDYALQILDASVEEGIESFFTRRQPVRLCLKGGIGSLTIVITKRGKYYLALYSKNGILKGVQQDYPVESPDHSVDDRYIAMEIDTSVAVSDIGGILGVIYTDDTEYPSNNTRFGKVSTSFANSATFLFRSLLKDGTIIVGKHMITRGPSPTVSKY